MREWLAISKLPIAKKRLN